eukprot:2850028-Rhodomonas_salina.1
MSPLQRLSGQLPCATLLCDVRVPNCYKLTLVSVKIDSTRRHEMKPMVTPGSGISTQFRFAFNCRSDQSSDGPIFPPRKTLPSRRCLVSPATCLYACYAMFSPEIACGATCLRACYAMSGTDTV